MKYLKNFNESISHDEINSICQKYNIRDYIINDDGTVDVDGSVLLSSHELTKLPLRFRKVSGYFDCSYNKLTSLEGAPEYVGFYFDCSNNKLTTLEGAPEYVSGFFCSHNRLISLEGAPKSVRDFYCSYNKLTSLEGAPTSLSGDFCCDLNPIYKWWRQINDKEKLEVFIDLGINADDPDWINQEKIDYIK